MRPQDMGLKLQFTALNKVVFQELPKKFPTYPLEVGCNRTLKLLGLLRLLVVLPPMQVIFQSTNVILTGKHTLITIAENRYRGLNV